MPAFLILIILGIILVIAAAKAPLPAELTGWFNFGGMACIAVGVI